jgi:hypothetical protein
MTWNEFEDELLQFYAKLANSKGWIDEARRAVREVEKLFPGFGQKVAKRMKELKNE